MQFFLTKHPCVPLIFRGYFNFWGVMLGGEGEVGSCSSDSHCGEELLDDGFGFWLGKCSGYDWVVSRKAHVDCLDDNGKGCHLDSCHTPRDLGFEGSKPGVSQDNVFPS